MSRLEATVFALLLSLSCADPSHAQRLGPRGMPLATTLTLKRPGPEEGFGSQRIIEIGYKQQTYRYILKDAYVDDPSGEIVWDDVWRSVQQFRPNFQLQGQESEKLARIQPGETVTVQGMYAPITRTFEVNNIGPPSPLSVPPKEY